MMLRRGTLYVVPWAAQCRSWARVCEQTGLAANGSDTREDIRRGFSEAHSGHVALATDVEVGDIRVSQSYVLNDTMSGSVRLRPSADMETRTVFDLQMRDSLNFRLNGRVADADRIQGYSTTWSAVPGYARDGVVANPAAGYQAPDSRSAADRAGSVVNTTRSTNPNLDGTTPLGNAVREIFTPPPWLIATMVIGGSLAALVAAAYVYRSVA